MREILFKAKRLDNGEWVFGYLTKMWHTWHIQDSDNENLAYMIDGDTICQYTGLHDGTKWERLSEIEREKFLAEWNEKENRRNQKEDWKGKKIWENDIICNHYDSLYPEEETMVLIVWDNFGWKIKEDSSAEEINIAIDIENCEVVGNIFDNPELLGRTDNGYSECNRKFKKSKGNTTGIC